MIEEMCGDGVRGRGGGGGVNHRFYKSVVLGALGLHSHRTTT